MPATKQINRNTEIVKFYPVLGGRYGNGSLVDEATNGFWWNSETYNNTRRYGLSYDGSSLYTYHYSRFAGSYIRCVSEEKDVSDLTYMQDMTPSVAANSTVVGSGQ